MAAVGLLPAGNYFARGCTQNSVANGAGLGIGRQAVFAPPTPLSTLPACLYMKMLRLSLLLVAFALAAATGCSNSGDEVSVDSAPFEAAIVDYLEKGSMGMAVHEFKELTVEGDTAKALVSLESADVPGPKVRWTFEFAKDSDGWKATSHKQ